ncbi:unnamed protein product [Candidula unifasciata]|uniref:Tyrosine-protein kinase n=1 Tax=Candidula unifasciata TaxID=100452 RepID=A0A8S3ZES8_9EUPU|nr:unnamed protein product [Candidula unifasciata]
MKHPVTLYAMPWYHGKISRMEAEQLLSSRKDGLYLVRDSKVYVGDYTLCVCFSNKVEHYHISYSNNQLSIDNEVFFKNLEELVQHYTNDADGLVSSLKIPVTKQGGKFGTVSMHDFRHGGWLISLHDLELGVLIGEGNFGDVYEGVYNDQKVAAKQLKDKERGEQAFLLEAAVMTSLNHHNVVQILGITEGTIILVTEFMEKGNLLEYLQTRGRSAITASDQIHFASDVCAAMEYLNNKGLIHRDLAARNILVNSKGTAKVSDFGLAQFCGLSLTSRQFPVKWTAPEALRDNTFNTKTDMWSFGILLWEIYSFGRVPYPRIHQTDVIKHIEGGYRMEAPEGCPPEIYSIMTDAWKLKPADRPTFSQVLSELNSMRSVLV